MNSRQDLVRLFCDLVRISSESGKEREFLNYMAALLQREFDAAVQFDSFENLVAKLAPKASAASAPLLLGMHADTVAPGVGIRPIIDGGIIKSDGTTVLGADDKAGIAELIIALRRASHFPPLEIVITREEERGLLGSKNLDFSLLSAKEGFVLDMDDLNVVVIGGPTKINLDIEIRGKAAHAGMEPEKGVSAIKAAAAAIAALPDGRVAEGTTCNIGVIAGGENRNSVPEKVALQAEVRSLDHEMAQELAERFRKVFSDTAASRGTRASIVSSVSYRAASMEKTNPTVLAACAALKQAGLDPVCKTIVGGTDASAYNERGIVTAVLGTGARKEHTKEEYILIEDMEKAVEVLVALLEHYAASE